MGMTACMFGSRLFGLAGRFLRQERMVFISFLVFEMCVGVYFPLMGTLKGRYVPEENRAAIYTLFRVPLNIIVITTLLAKASTTEAFKLCALMLGTAAIAFLKLGKPQAPEKCDEEASAASPDGKAV